MPLRTLNMLVGLAMIGTFAGCTSQEDKETGEPVVEDEICDNDADDDGDGDTDCDDSDCTDDAACDTTPTEETDCEDGLDDDADGDIDCDDADCAADAACISVDTETLCNDGLDDDADGAIDCLDTDCAADAACNEPTTELNCVDGIDDDRDGAYDCDDTDCAADAACATPGVETLCADGLDDDADGTIDCLDTDCAADAACAIPSSETNCTDGLDEDADGTKDCDDSDCAADAACVISVETACADAIDDDADGLTDCDDSDCAADAACIAPPSTCGTDGDLASGLGYALATGTTVGGGDDYLASCNYSTSSAEDVSFVWTAPADGTYTVTTSDSDFDTVLSVMNVDCGSEASCDDDGGSSSRSSATDFTVVSGEQVVFLVDGYGVTGNYVLSVYSSSETDCRDGADEDGDGGADCADTECATDVTCIPESECEDTLDSDLDGAADCDDSDCAEELYCTNPCADDDLGSVVGASVATGSTTGAGDDYTGSCADYSGVDDVAWLWTAPADGVYTFDTLGSAFDTVLSVEQGDCSDTELDCNDDSSGLTSALSVALLAGEEVVVQVDGYDSADTGDYVLSVWSDAEVDCADGGDEDDDGDIDCADSECAAAAACNESVCDDGADDEGDGYVDCLDSQCAADAVCDTASADYDLGSTTGSSIATGTTIGGGDDFSPSCTSSYAEDVAYAWVAPTAGAWTFDLSGSAYDTVMSLYTAGGVALACDDDGSGTADSLEVLYVNEGQLVIVDIDGYSAGSGDYVLSIY